MPAKLDFRREFPDYYAAPKEPRLAHFGPIPYLALAGRGAPGGPEFQRAVGTLFAAAYAVKFHAKAKGRDFTIPALEAQWWTQPPQDFAKAPMSAWRWQVLLRVPANLKSSDLKASLGPLKAKHPELDLGGVHLQHLDEGDCVQALHVGPYKAEGRTVKAMARHAEEVGLHLAGRHHEIYLNDPRRVGEAKAKTIIRCPVAA